jgi:hypothetical protein
MSFTCSNRALWSGRIATVPSLFGFASTIESGAHPAGSDAMRGAILAAHARAAAAEAGSAAIAFAVEASSSLHSFVSRSCLIRRYGLSTSISGGKGESLFMPLSSGSGVYV